MTIGAAEGLLNACLYEPGRFPQALEEVGRLLGHDYFGLVSADFSRPRFIISDRQREALDAFFAGGWGEGDYRIQAEAATSLGELFLDHVHVEDSVRRSSAVFNEFFRPHDMTNYAGIRFEVDGAQWYCAAARGEARGVIDGADARAFVHLAGVAIRTMSVLARLERVHANGILDGLELSQTPAILLDRDGRVAEITSAARQLLDEGFNVRGGQLWAAGPEDASVVLQLTMLARSAGATGPRSFYIRNHGMGGPIAIEASQVVGPGLDMLSGRLLLLLTDVHAKTGRTAQVKRLAAGHGLTGAEADILGKFAEGRTIAEIAVHRGVAQSTIREQMKSIYIKTGVHRQVDLLRLLDTYRQ